MQVDEGEKMLMSRTELENKLATLTGGRAAEEVVFGSVMTTGASNDIEQATKLARAMITRYGMQAVGLLRRAGRKPGFQCLHMDGQLFSEGVHQTAKLGIAVRAEEEADGLPQAGPAGLRKRVQEPAVGVLKGFQGLNRSLGSGRFHKRFLLWATLYGPAGQKTSAPPAGGALVMDGQVRPGPPHRRGRRPRRRRRSRR